MIKLFTLENVSSWAEDAVYKICLALEEWELLEEKNENYDELIESALSALNDFQHVVIGAEVGGYNQLKKTLISKLGLEESYVKEISSRLSKNADKLEDQNDAADHSLMPAEAVTHLTMDGLYCGFTVRALNGILTLMPLDFMRIDTVLDDFKAFMKDEIRPSESSDGNFENTEAPDFDFAKNVERMVNSLKESGGRIALVTGEATMWIYNLYNQVPGITDVASFVEIVDETAKDEDAEEEATVQTESVKLVGKARDAMMNAGTEMGGAISDIYSTENDNGEQIYFSYVAVVDKGVAKAKKLSTSNPDDLELLLPHAVTLLCDTVTTKAKALTESKTDSESDEADGEPKKKFSKNMMIFAAIVIVIAMIIPVAVMFNLLNEDPTTTASPNPGETLAPNVSDPLSSANTTSDPFGATSTTLPPAQNVVPQSSAQDVSAPETTAAPVSSTSGIFTFYVFGYGHGVGMSQVGANYLAQQGWTAAEILAHYYYDPNTAIITGEKYPDKITYNGAQYDTREYLAGALESEMGSSFSYEALKAQAIAIYTFAKYNSYNLSQDAHAYGKTPSELCYRVVDDVMNTGYYIAYGNDVAVTPFHAMSAGVTTSYYNVWGKGIGANVPYLAGGRKSYGDYLDSNYKSVYTITSDDMKKIAKEKLEVELTGDPAYWLSVVTHDKAVREDIGYVSSINVGGKIITGNEFRIKVMEGKIRSHCFTVVYTPDT